MAVKATPKALKKIETAEREKGEELSKWEKVKVAGPSYVPAVMIGAATVTCVIGANLLTSRRQANIASAYVLVNESYKQYQNKVREIYGDEAHRDIMEEADAIYFCEGWENAIGCIIERQVAENMD